MNLELSLQVKWTSLNFFLNLILSDSTVLAYVLSELNTRHNYGLDLFLLSVDEGITGYRDDSLETVKRNEMQVKWSEFRPQAFCHLH